MDPKLLAELNAVVNMLDHLQITMQICEDKSGTIPLSYSYLYELGILRLLEIFDSAPDFLDVIKKTTAKAMSYLVDMYKEYGTVTPIDDKLKRLNDAIKKAKQESEVEKVLEEELPPTIGTFLNKYTKESCLITKSLKDPMDKLLDEYLAAKERAIARKKAATKAKKAKNAKRK